MTSLPDSHSSVPDSRDVHLVPGIVAKAKDFRMRYVTESGGSLPICRIVGQRPSFTTVRSPSGTGKSTLLERFVGRLRDRTVSSVDDLDFTLTARDGSHPSVAIGIVPQNPPLVKHWSLQRLLCAESWAAKAAFGSNWNGLGRRVLGELSGGQQRRVYACSVTESLEQRSADAAILILDETIDGLNPDGAGEFIDHLVTAWSERQQRPLHILLVTHLPTIAAVCAVEVFRISLGVVRDTASELTVRVAVVAP